MLEFLILSREALILCYETLFEASVLFSETLVEASILFSETPLKLSEAFLKGKIARLRRYRVNGSYIFVRGIRRKKLTYWR